MDRSSLELRLLRLFAGLHHHQVVEAVGLLLDYAEACAQRRAAVITTSITVERGVTRDDLLQAAAAPQPSEPTPSGLTRSQVDWLLNELDQRLLERARRRPSR